ncbi:MAG: ABC-F family ATP-binding cassette domain-containing protein [Bacilli bacterium]
MSVLELQELSKTYGVKTLFSSVNASIAPGEHIGLLGRNGSGKSTLLSIIAGVEHADSGQIVKANDYSMYYVTQKDNFDENAFIMETLFSDDSPLMRTIRTYSTLSEQLKRSTNNEEILEQFHKVSGDMDRLDGWSVVHRAESLLQQFGLNNFQSSIGELSGGERKKVSIVAALLHEVDLLILDEPTNHLDVDSISTLQSLLKRKRCSILLVTHDRYFLEAMTNRIFELSDGNLHSYTGTYSTYLEKRAEREQNERAQHSKLKNAFRREYEWIKRGAKARTTKQKARIERFYEIEENLEKTGGQKSEMNIGFQSERLGKTVFEFEDASIAIENRVLWRNFSTIVQRGERIGIVGENGAGKTTLLQVLCKERALQSGTINVGETVRIAHYTQQAIDLPGNKRAIEYLREYANEVIVGGERLSVSALLEQFLFPPGMHGVLIDKLSGGEKKRLYLVRLLLEKPNVLLLDEPTNDFDLDTLIVLENFLDDWDGVVLCVSHDRYFLDRVVTKLWHINPNQEIETFIGNYSEWREKKVETVVEAPVVKKEGTAPVVTKERKRFGFKEQQEWKQLQQQVPDTEEKLEELAQQIDLCGADFERLQKLTEELEKTEQLLEHYYERWTELEELQA